MKICDNCYWKTGHDKFCSWHLIQPKEGICDRHQYMCESCNYEIATHIYDNDFVCEDCLLNKVNIETRLETRLFYYHNNDCLGDEESEIFELVKKIEVFKDRVKEIED